jgi:glycosyltransferase involved in cell wall biosynthesis
MLAGFQRYCRKYEQNDVLIVKILVDGKYNTFSDVLQVILPRRCAESLNPFELIDCKNIILVCGLLTDAEMNRLYCNADFYLCTSNAEGQNLPLLEAMAHGVVPISPATTAMADYVSGNNSVVLQATESQIYESAASAYGLSETHWDEVSTSEVVRGLEAAQLLDADRLKAKRAAAIKTVNDHYGPAAVAALVRQRFRAIDETCNAKKKFRMNRLDE